MEILDLYRKDGSPTGLTIKRGEDIPYGYCSLACEALIKHEDGSYLCMRRSSTKDVVPGYLETSVGGGALSGEDPIACIKREAAEESGLILKDLEEIGITINEDRRHIIHSYLAVVKVNKNSIKLQPEETEDYCWLTEEEFKDLMTSDKAIPTQRERLLPFLRASGILN